MISIDKGYIKSTPEYEDLGENIFPVDILTDEEKKELGLVKSGCCGSKGGCCSGAKTPGSCCQKKRNNDECGK